MSSDWSTWLDESLAGLEEEELLRDLRPLEVESAVHVVADGEPVTLFSSNDYLGLSDHPRIRHAASAAANNKGMGPRGSPLICGYTDRHAQLESKLSGLEKTEATLLCPTGFAANLAAISSLSGPGVEVFSDAYNHASIIDGCRLGRRKGAELTVYDHADPEDLDAKLAASEADRKLVVTDSVFSMDGDLAPLPEIVELKERHGALLMIDEAHGTLVFGETGAGVSEHFGLSDRVDINVGTLSKAFGALGGFISTSQKLKRWILNRGRSYIYSTASPLPVVAAASRAIDVVSEEPEIRRRLRGHVERLGEALGRQLASPIAPIVVGGEQRALEASRRLLERGIHCTAIRPPTVPEGTSRLRITLSAAHSDDDLDHLIGALSQLDLLER